MMTDANRQGEKWPARRELLARAGNLTVVAPATALLLAAAELPASAAPIYGSGDGNGRGNGGNNNGRNSGRGNGGNNNGRNSGRGNGGNNNGRNSGQGNGNG